MSSSQLTPKEIKEKKAAKVEMKEHVCLTRYKKRKADEVGLDQGKTKGEVASLVLIPDVGQPRKKLIAKKLSGVVRNLKEAEAMKVSEVKRIKKR